MLNFLLRLPQVGIKGFKKNKKKSSAQVNGLQQSLIVGWARPTLSWVNVPVKRGST